MDVYETELVPEVERLLPYAKRLMGNLHDAEDLYQDTRLKAWRARHTYQPGTSPRAWATTMMKNLAYDRYRLAKRRPELLRPNEELHNRDVAASAEATYVSALVDDRIELTLEAMPAQFAEAVRLRDVERFEYNEIGALTGVKRSTAATRIHRGRAMLKAALEEADL
jgi:RNA polymerase sigma-70 factor (ECF subfamily)